MSDHWLINSNGSMTCPKCGESHGNLYRYDPSDFRKMTCPKCGESSGSWLPSKELSDKILLGEFIKNYKGAYVPKGEVS